MSDLRSGEPSAEDASEQAGFDQAGFDQSGFLGFEPAPLAASPPQAGYRVLARKYRPQTFADLIGQDAMVQTVKNSFAASRIPQAWMLTGVRGVGKTTTARILARALNYDAGGGGSGPSIEMPGLGLHCRSIMESRHVDVLELDAASHTGVENMRQITDAIRYAPIQARYKVYIIDEVHMLSASAFNAFLKTLEEPPPHAKFVLATTEIRKVPVTILSRCQRFDLRRVEAATLVAHLDRICRTERIEAEPAALAAIARAAEGSVRDALSLLDQAVAHGAGTVSEAGVREMMGLADRGQVIDLFEAAMRGDVPSAFATLRAGYEAGADPRQMMEDLASFTHVVTRLKLVPDAAADAALTESERVRGAAFAGRLSVRVLSRAWQILLKAVPEVGGSQRPLATAEMALVRLAYAADLPTPDELLRTLKGEAVRAATPPVESPTGRAVLQAPHAEVLAEGEPQGTRDRRASFEADLRSAPQDEGLGGPKETLRSGSPESVGRLRPLPSVGGGGALALARPEDMVRPDAVARSEALPAARANRSPEPSARAEPARAEPRPLVLGRFEDVVALAGERREVVLKAALERDVRLVRFEDGQIEIALEPGASRTLPGELSRALGLWTGRRWVVAVSAAAVGTTTIAENRQRRETERRDGAAEHPLVQAVLRSFPGAAIVDVRERAPDLEEAAVAAAPDPEAVEDDDL